MLKELIKDKSAKFYASSGGKITLFSIAILSLLIFAHSAGALTLSCSFSSTCPYPGLAILYAQNETGGFDNAHAQNTSAISLEGLLAWYRFDNMSFAGENGTNVFDWSGRGNNATASGGAVETSGKINGAYLFDGVNDFLSVPYTATLAPRTSNFSVAAWFNSASFSGSQRIISKTETGGYQLSINENGVCPTSTLCFTLYNGSAYYASSIPTSSLVTNAWYHVVGTFNGTQMSLYVNGSLVNISTSVRGAISYSTNNQFCIGNEPGSTCNAGSQFNGSIDEVMVFNRSLSAQEVSNLFNRSFYTYNSALCCTADTNLTSSCVQSTPVRIANYTNDHVQLGNYGGTAYPVPVCISSEAGKVQCNFPTGSCSAGYTCLGSIASSEPGALNLTNSHIASCAEYDQKICCRINTPPVVSNVIINSTFRTNYTTENLTVYFTSSDADSDPVTNITDWRINGTSIAVVNMPFNSDENSSTSNILRDYSTYGNNGTLVNTVWDSDGGFDGGGAYIFNNTLNSAINLGNSAAVNPPRITVAAWIYPWNAPNARVMNIFSNSRDCCGTVGAMNGTFFQWTSSYGGLQAAIRNGSSTAQVNYNTGLVANQWYHVAYTYNGTHLQLYLNGALVGSTPSTVGIGIPSYNTYIGRMGFSATSYSFNGTIDDFKMYDRALSAEQIYLIYSNRSSIISSQETFGGENWTCAVTPNDGRDGNTVLSNSLIIKNSLPTVTLTSPADNNVTTNRTPMFNWTGFDADGDALTYEINITAVLVNGTSLCSDVRTVSTGSNNYYIPSGDLLCLADNQMVYKWSVRASDAGGTGAWSTPRTLNISAYVAVSLPTNSVEFGSITILQSNDTTDDAPLPFRIQNDGTVLLNVNISATDLWSSVPSPNKYYQYKVGNVTGEEGAFNWSGSVTTFTNFSTTGGPSIDRLNYSNSKDIARTDIYVEVPSNEQPAVRNSTVTFMSLLGEF